MESNGKQKSTLIRDAIALFLITLVAGMALSYIYEITKAPINRQQEEKKIKANQAVFVAAGDFQPDEQLMDLAANTDLSSLDKAYDGISIDEISKALDSSNEVIGYNITISTTQCYDDVITLVFGYSTEGVIQGIEYTTISETAGLGMKAKNAEFKDQFLNKKVKKFEVTKTGAVSEEQIDAISGATITTKAVTNAVNAGVGFMTDVAGVIGGGQ